MLFEIWDIVWSARGIPISYISKIGILLMALAISLTVSGILSRKYGKSSI
jgi:hypothetical protein